MSVTGERYQSPGTPVSAFYDVRKDFYALLSKKCFLMRDLRQASVERWRMAGQLNENSGRPVGSAKRRKTAISVTLWMLVRGRFLVFVILRPLKMVLIGQAHHLLEYSREVGWGHAGSPDNDVEADICSVVVVDKKNGPQDLMVLAESDGGRLRPRQRRRIRPG
jgi:hypothetical protein